jgi:hypothetical protein
MAAGAREIPHVPFALTVVNLRPFNLSSHKKRAIKYGFKAITLFQNAESSLERCTSWRVRLGVVRLGRMLPDLSVKTRNRCAPAVVWHCHVT